MASLPIASTSGLHSTGARARSILVVGPLDPLVKRITHELDLFAEVHAAGSADHALEWVEDHVPSLLLVTLGVLHYDERWPALRRMATKHHIPLLLFGRDDATSFLTEHLQGIDHFVNSVDPEVVTSRVKSILECSVPEHADARLNLSRWEFALDGAALAVWELDVGTGQVTGSKALFAALDAPHHSRPIPEAEWLAWTHPQDLSRVQEARRQLREGLAPEIRLEYRIVASEGRVVWVREVARPIEYSSLKPSRVMGVVKDTTQQRASERRLVQLANYDLLTDLPNRKKCSEFLVEAVERAVSTGESACLVRVDIRGIAHINQIQGRVAGDLALQQVASRLRDLASDPEKVCRLGGKEFAFIIERIDRASAMARAAEIAADVARSFAEPLTVLDMSISCLAHTGACVFPEEGSLPEELLRKADIALADAVQDGRSFAVFRKSMLKRVEARSRLLKDLQHAVISQHIGLEYQPIVDGSGRLTGVEGLPLWNHPSRGQIPASEFIPLAVESGLIVPLGASLRRRAVEQLLRWQSQPLTSELVLSLNVSPIEFEAETFAKDLILTIESLRIEPRKLVLQFSESVLHANPESLTKRMRVLSEAGIRLALDDFGTGFSSLQLLKKLPFEQLKLDRSFVSEVLTDTVDASLSRAIVAMAQNLGLEVMAEGVEEESQMRILTEMGCSRFQGPLFGRATDEKTIELRASEEAAPPSPWETTAPAPVSTIREDEADARILVVDDDPTTLQLIARILRDYSNVQTTASPLEALKLVERRPPDLLLLDTQMPELNGFELWQTLKSNPRFADIPAVFVTALLDPETEIKALSMGAADFVSKPISAARLKLAVRNQVRIKRQTDSLRQQASMDGLTDVANRRSFDRALKREWSRAVEGKSPLSLLMIDVDHFKLINDKFGHLAGDQCLISVARVLTRVIRRPMDLIARYGGEEFAAILPLAGEEQAATFASEIVQEVGATNFNVDLSGNHHVTVSVGWTTLNGSASDSAGTPLSAMIRRADEALLLAKKLGRNRVCGPRELSLEQTKVGLS